jgi:hypothetical protein
VNQPATAPGLQLFIYWRCQAADADVATAAARQLQQRLRQQHPALQAHLFRRSDSDAATCTLMETYALPPAGIGPALQAELQTAGAALQPWLLGTRHVEVFQPLA